MVHRRLADDPLKHPRRSNHDDAIEPTENALRQRVVLEVLTPARPVHDVDDEDGKGREGADDGVDGPRCHEVHVRFGLAHVEG